MEFVNKCASICTYLISYQKSTVNKLCCSLSALD